MTSKGIKVDVKYAVETVTKFLPDDWSDVDPSTATLTPFSGGYVNSLWIVQNNKTNDNKYNKVILRHYGGNVFEVDEEHTKNGSGVIKTSETEEVLIMQTHSYQGWGPQILGVFPGGRIEEFIESHTLTYEEASRPDIIQDLATCFARFHSIKLPLPKDRLANLQKVILNPPHPEKKAEMMAKLPILLASPEVTQYGIDLGSVLSINFMQEFKWMFQRIHELKSKPVLTICDTNFLNCLIRENPQLGETKTVLIDYELSMYSFRGIDLGGHFVNRMIKWNDKKHKASGHEYPSEDQRRMFVKHYLEEKKRLDASSIHPSVDNEDHLMEESDVGSLWFCLFFGVGMIQKLEKVVTAESSFVTVLPLLFNFYRDYKEICNERYSHWTMK